MARLLAVRLDWRPAVAAVLVLAAVFAGTLTLYPPARAWAQDTLDGLLAYFGVTRGPQVLPTITVRRVAPDEVTPDVGSSSVLLTRKEAEAKVGFPVRVPTYLPPGYRPAAGFEVVAKIRGVVWKATEEVTDDSHDPCSGRIGDLSFAQVPAAESRRFPFPVGKAKVRAITVNGAPGLWVEKVVVSGGVGYNPDGSVMCTYKYFGNILSWEKDGIRYSLTGDASLGLDEMLRVAESVR